MTTLFPAATRLEAWLDAVEYLLKIGSDINVVLSISSPESDGTIAQAAHPRIDEFYASLDEAPLHTVAETIFPGWEYSRRGLRGVYETYDEEYVALKRGDPSRWGTYAHRILRRQTSAGVVIRPLESLIDKMRSELKLKGRGTYKACYEVGVAEGEYDLPLYNTVDDRNRRRGLPCLTHLSFKIYKKSLHLTALYRSHDYSYKVPGNLLGLARLQACVAKEVGLPIGSLVVHSTYAWIQTTKGPLKQLVADLRGLIVQEGKT